MTQATSEGFGAPISFDAEAASKRKKGVQRPRFAQRFVEPSIVPPPFRDIKLFVNPYSGKRQGEKIAGDVQQQLSVKGLEVETIVSQYSGHLVTLAQQVDTKEGTLFVVVGGDGTLSEVISGRLLRDPHAKEYFAIIPAGTGNSQAHDLSISSVDSAIEAILSGRAHGLDVARIELTEGLPGHEAGRIVRYSHNLVTWGLGVDSTIQAEKMRWMGPIRYDVGIVLAILANKKRNATLTLNGKTVKDDFTLFLIQNTQTGGSLLPLAPGASLDDGEMDIGLLKKMNRRALLKAFGMLKSEGRHVFHPRVDYHRFTSLSIETEFPTAINVDGENLGSTPLQMEVFKQALNIMVPNLE